jgi:hypothetical protein
MARTYEQVALTVLVVSEVPNFWSGFLPSLFTIATFSGGDEVKAEHTKHWIRRGEVQATGLSIALGVSASLLAGEPWPFIGVVLLSCYLAYQYEHALRLGLSHGLNMNIGAQ